jgi:hypothetical protein
VANNVGNSSRVRVEYCNYERLAGIGDAEAAKCIGDASAAQQAEDQLRVNAWCVLG